MHPLGSRIQQQKFKGQVPQVKETLERFSYPYNRRIAGAHGRFKKKEYDSWLRNVESAELSRALSRLAQLNQPKVYLFLEARALIKKWGEVISSMRFVLLFYVYFLFFLRRRVLLAVSES